MYDAASDDIDNIRDGENLYGGTTLSGYGKDDLDDLEVQRKYLGEVIDARRSGERYRVLPNRHVFSEEPTQQEKQHDKRQVEKSIKRHERKLSQKKHDSILTTEEKRDFIKKVLGVSLRLDSASQAYIDGAYTAALQKCILNMRTAMKLKKYKG